MKKAIVCLTIIFILVGTSLNAQSGTTKKVEISLATWHWTEPGRTDVLKKMIADFNKEYPNIIVKPLSVPYSRYEEQMMIQLAAEDAPDVMVAADIMFFAFLNRGYLAQLDKLIDLNSIKQDFLDAQNIAVIDGKTYGINTEHVTYAVLYNNDIFKKAGISEPPKTPDEFIKVATKLTNAPESYGYATRHSLEQEGGWWYELSFWVEGFGGIWAANGKPTVNSKEVVEGIKYFKKMYDSGIFPKGVSSSTYRRMFWEEKVAMLTDNQATLMLTKSENPKAEFLAAPGPFTPAYTNAEIVLYTIPESSKNKKEASIFLTWFYKHLVDYGLGVQNVVGSKSANVKILEKYPFLKTFTETPIADNGGILPKGWETKYPEFRHTVLLHVSNILIKNADVQKEMNAAQSELEKMIK